jgi:hypothetical protein
MNELPYAWTMVRWHIASLPNLARPNEQEVFEIYHGHYRVEEEPHEVRNSCVRDAIAGPWAVMIHLRDASFADLAMMRTWWFDGVAFAAVPCPFFPVRLVILCLLVS